MGLVSAVHYVWIQVMNSCGLGCGFKFWFSVEVVPSDAGLWCGFRCLRMRVTVQGVGLECVLGCGFRLLFYDMC